MKRTRANAWLLAAAVFALPALAAPPPDGWLTAKAKVALLTSPEVEGTSLNVDTNEGMITLHGKVESAQQKSAAERIAKAISGVKSVRNLLQVVPESAEERVEQSDDRIKEAVQQRLQADPTLEDSGIEVKSVNQGVVLLAGKTETVSDYVRALTLVNRVQGVRRVASEVKAPDRFGEDELMTMDMMGERHQERMKQMGDKPGQMMKERGQRMVGGAHDMRISHAVKVKLLTTAELPATDINVDARDGVVTLFGFVPNEQLKETAVQEARKVQGVKEVENQLAIAPGKQPKTAQVSDQKISSQLEKEFKKRPELEHVKTSVEDGKVTLTGTVGSGWDHLRALRWARQIEGVRALDDQLQVQRKGAPERRY